MLRVVVDPELEQNAIAAALHNPTALRVLQDISIGQELRWQEMSAFRYKRRKREKDRSLVDRKRKKISNKLIRREGTFSPPVSGD